MALPVNLSSVPNIYHENHEHRILDLIDDAIIPHSDAVKRQAALQLHAPRRTRISSQRPDGRSQTFEKPRIAQSSEIFFGLWLN